MEEFENWVRVQGGTMPGEEELSEEAVPLGQETGVAVDEESDSADADIPAP